MLTFSACSDDESDFVDIRLNIQGMACMSCEREVTDLLTDLGVVVTSISAQLNTATVEFYTSQITRAEIISALADAGYEVSN